MRKFCYYRNHLCYIDEIYADGSLDLTTLADEMTDGTLRPCGCNKDKFIDVIFVSNEILELTNYETTNL